MKRKDDIMMDKDERLIHVNSLLLEALEEVLWDWQTLTSQDFGEGNEDVIRITELAQTAIRVALQNKKAVNKI